MANNATNGSVNTDREEWAIRENIGDAKPTDYPVATDPGNQNTNTGSSDADYWARLGNGGLTDQEYLKPPEDQDPPVPGSGVKRSSSASSDYTLTMPTGPSADELAKQRAELSAALNPQADPANIQRVAKYDKQPMVDLATQQIEAARQQYNGQINRSMDQNAVELTRALADAQQQYQTQQNQVTAEEMNARDNAALYAEARGDKGGIGQAQYTNIVNNAARNRTSVRQAQSKIANDTARQISSLRAQGEFDKADKMLELTQSYLSELRQIEEYATNYNLSVDQINTAIQEWEAEYNRAAQQYATSTELSLANLTGRFNNGTPTYEAQQNTEAQLAKIALSLIEAGVRPDKLSESQLLALQSQYGMDANAIKAYAAKVK